MNMYIKTETAEKLKALASSKNRNVSQQIEVLLDSHYMLKELSKPIGSVEFDTEEKTAIFLRMAERGELNELFSEEDRKKASQMSAKRIKEMYGI